jgi:hypothetical protein
LVTIISQRLYCEAYALKSNNANSFPPHLSYPKGGLNKVVPQVNSKLPVALPPSILSDYYNSIISNSGQHLDSLPHNNWPQTEFIPLTNVVEDEYDNGDEYYNYEPNPEQVRIGNSDIYFGNDAYQPEGWFNGPVIYDSPDSDSQNDDSNDAQLSNLLMSYLFDQIDKLKQKESSEKTYEESKGQNSKPVTTLPSVTSPPSTISTMTTHSTPKKLTSKQFRLFQRGQKEFPLLRPASENEEKNSESQVLKWPTELEETELKEEDSLMSLKQKGQLRTVRDVLTAQLDNLKKEGPKMH